MKTNTYQFYFVEINLCSEFDTKILYRRSVIVTLCRPPPYQDWGRARTDGKRFARDDKELGPQLGEAITRKTASLNRRDLTHELSAQPACSEERRRSTWLRRRADRTRHL